MDDFGSFRDAVMDLWPRYKTTDGELQAVHDRIRRHGSIEIHSAMKGHKYDEPDQYKPMWRVVFVALSETAIGPKTKRSELKDLIANQRRQLQGEPIPGRPPEREWSDRDIVELRLQIDTQSIMSDRYGKRVDREHPEWERRDRTVRHREYFSRSALVQDLELRGDEVPDWLPCEMPYDLRSVEECNEILDEVRKNKNKSKGKRFKLVECDAALPEGGKPHTKARDSDE